MAGIPEFDHRDPGTDEAVWATTPVLNSAARLDLRGFPELVVIAAHPDDESLGAGGLLSAASMLGLAVTVVIATLGEQSHPLSTTHSPDTLKVIRRAEVFAALEAVAPTASVRILGLPDGHLAAHLTALTEAIRQAVTGPSTLVVAPWRGDGHPDHQAVGEATAAASAGATLLQYPIWAWHWGGPDDLPVDLLRLDLDAADADAKRRAVRAHRSQIEPLSDRPGDEAIVSAGFAAHFERPFEIFVAESPAIAGPDGGGVGGGDSGSSGSLPGTFFDDFYGGAADPWGFQTRWYERRKRDLTMAALPRERFARAFEPGCSIGVLTARLAARCDEVLATDISGVPLRSARSRFAGNAGVRVEQMRIPQEWPIGAFDLIVLSEVAYYCDASDLQLLIGRAVASLSGDGVLVACHWRHPVPEYPLSGDQVHRALRAEARLGLLVEHREEDFVLELFTRPPTVSVATTTGLVP